MSSANTTTGHATIKKWVEGHGGRPAVVESTHEDGKSGGLLRIDFGEKDDRLEEIGWDEWFKIFDENKLAFLHGEGDSRFNKLVAREHA